MWAMIVLVVAAMAWAVWQEVELRRAWAVVEASRARYVESPWSCGPVLGGIECFRKDLAEPLAPRLGPVEMGR
jgi:uncharacterized membrane protein YccC